MFMIVMNKQNEEIRLFFISRPYDKCYSHFDKYYSY